MPQNSSRYELVSRRAALQRSLAIGALGAATLIPGLGCSNSDSTTLSDTAITTTTAASNSTNASTTTASGSDATTTTAAAAASGDAFPTGGELTVDFTISGSGKNPYAAVWIEDSNGELVATLGAWYLNSPKGQRYLHELQRWYGLGGVSTATAVTGATSSASDYSLTWNGTNADGEAVAQGTYTLYIEAAREHGSYELASQEITIGSKGFSTEVSPDGEITAATVALKV
jgi:hypothetical protein